MKNKTKKLLEEAPIRDKAKIMIKDLVNELAKNEQLFGKIANFVIAEKIIHEEIVLSMIEARK